MKADSETGLRAQPQIARDSIFALFKGQEDLERGRTALERWLADGASKYSA
jgi:hypothetical protein